LQATKADLLEQPLADLILPADRDAFQERLAQLVAEARGGAWDVQIQGTEDRPLVVSLSLAPITDTQVAVVGLRWLLRDVTEPRTLEAALRESEARWRALFAAAPLGIVLLDLAGRITASNPAFQQLVAAPADTLTGTAFLAWIAPPERAAVAQHLAPLLAEQAHPTPLDTRVRHADNQTRWVALRGSLAPQAAGQPPFVMLMVDDISAQKEMAAELREVRRRLTESREAERLYLAQELHDVPLQALHSADLLLSELAHAGPEAATQALMPEIRTSILQATQTLRALCTELRPPALESFGLQTAIQAHAEQLAAEHPTLTVQLALAFPDRVLPQWVGLTLFRIYQQALHNVVQHAAAQQITVRLWGEQTELVLEVEDDGRGFVVPARWVELARHNHLGLVGSAERAESIGARYTVTSAPGAGTTVRVMLPLATYMPP
jgi:PAS domain S-box-containing protein